MAAPLTRAAQLATSPHAPPPPPLPPCICLSPPAPPSLAACRLPPPIIVGRSFASAAALRRTRYTAQPPTCGRCALRCRPLLFPAGQGSGGVMDLDLAIVGFDDRQQLPSPSCVHPGAGMAFMFSCMYGSGTSSPDRPLSRTSSEGSLREVVATTPGSPLRAPSSHEIHCHDSVAPLESKRNVSEPQSPRPFETTGSKNAESAASHAASEGNKQVPCPPVDAAPASPHSVLVPASPHSSPPSPPHRTNSTRASKAATAGASADEWAVRSLSDKSCTLASGCTGISVAAVARSSSCADLSHALLLSPQAAAEVLRSMPRPGQPSSAPPSLSSSEAPVVAGGQSSDADAAVAAPASASDLNATTASHSKWWGGRKQQQQQIHQSQGQGQLDAQNDQHRQEQQQKQQQQQGIGWHPTPGPPRALAGLKNLGNTCFVNACVQCLNNSAPLALYFLSSSTHGPSRTAEGLDLASFSVVGGEFGGPAAHEWRTKAAKSAMYGAQAVGSKSLNNIAELDRCGEVVREVGEWGASCRAAAGEVQARGPEKTPPRSSKHCRAAAAAAADASAEQRQIAPVQLGLAGGWSSALIEGEQADGGSGVKHVERCGGFGPIAEVDEGALALGSPKRAAGREVAGGGTNGPEDAHEDAEDTMVAGACRRCEGGRLSAPLVHCVDSGDGFLDAVCCSCGEGVPQLRECGNGEGLQGQGGDGEGLQEADNAGGLAVGALQQDLPQRPEVVSGRLYVQDRDESTQQRQQQQSGQEVGGNGGGVAGALRSLVVELWAAQPRAALNPRPLVESVQRQLPQFAGYGQHDSQEFLRALVDQLAAEEVERSTAASSATAASAAAASAARGCRGAVAGSSSSSSAGPIQRMFCGQLQSSIECQSCRRASLRCEPFLDLSLPIPKKLATPPPPQQQQRQPSPQLLPRHQHRHQQQQHPQRTWLSLWNSLWTGSTSASPASPTKAASAHARLSGRAMGGSAAAAAAAAEQAQGWGPARSGVGKGGGGVSITDCMEVMMADERLDGDNKYDCSHCKSLQPAVRRLSIERFPPILVLHLKRTVATVASETASSGALSALAAATGLGGRGGYGGYTFQKDSTPVACDLHSLDLTRFASAATMAESATGAAHSADVCDGAECGEGLQADLSGQEGRVLYDLYAVMNHMGSISSGHYTAHCRNVDDGQWYAFNDASVERIASKHDVVTPNAYVLFYELRSS